ncbi:MAG TPA: nicotinate-nucleotide adenylyltransferase [Candidatus Acidoferrales bacterium]|nr:nicotinate-nucleotide adenylyltransferase [Candidatus Acidoferrales bacterium]
MRSRRGIRKRGSRAIAIFGGTFDPIHNGHVAVAKAAAKRFRLDEIYFLPSSRPPHKKPQELAGFAHRYAMVCLACAGNSRFVPSLAEAPPETGKANVFYSIDTVRCFHREHTHEQIYFIVGADSFLEISAWKSYEEFLDSCDFIIASRPGFKLDKLREVIPPKMLSAAKPADRDAISLRKSTAYLLTAVSSYVSSTDIRRRRKRGQSIHALVPAPVEDYILKQALYR